MRYLVALAVSLDGNGIKFGLGDNGNLSMEVDAKVEINIRGTTLETLCFLCTYSPVITTSGD